MTTAWNTKQIGQFDCPGGGQVWVDGTTLYVGHMRNPHGTTIVDVGDPRKPRVLTHIQVPEGWHSHKVRVANGVMIVNHERFGQGNEEFGAGLGIYDVTNPAEPKSIAKWRTHGKGVHRYEFDGRYAYISPTAEGYVGNIVMILDMLDPAHPEEVGRWWIPGQWAAGGEEYPWTEFVPPRCHHPLRVGNRLYVSYWHHGGYILDISDMARPRPIAHINTKPAFPHPTHTLLKMRAPLKGREILLVADEDVAKLRPHAPSFAWVYDVSDETRPAGIATYQVAGIDPDGNPQPPMSGCHQPSERFSGSIVPFAWFAQGLRLVDFADPFAPQEVGFFKPDPAPGSDRVSSNDVTLDSRGLVYLIDRVRGVSIIETNVW